MEIETQSLLKYPASVSLHQPRPTASKRNATPPPRAKTVEEKAEKDADEDDESSVESEQELPEYTGKLILGFHPQAFMAIVSISRLLCYMVAINVFFAVCAVGAGPGRTYIASAMTTFSAYWKTVSSPLSDFIVAWADFIVTGVALVGLSPLVATVAIAFVRAFFDLRHAPLWQKMSLAALISASLATLVISRERVLWLVQKLKVGWDKVSDPVEKFLIDYSDHMIATAALICLVPLGLALVSYMLGAIWNCRVKLVVEPVEAGETQDAPLRKKDA